MKSSCFDGSNFLLSDGLSWDEDDVAQMLISPPSNLRDAHVATQSPTLSVRSGPAMSSNWTLEEDLCLCRAVVEKGGLSCKNLSVGWIQANLQPMPAELANRQIGALILRFNYLRDEVITHLSVGDGASSWDWLVQKHQQPARVIPYTFEEDLAICQLVVAMNLVDEPLGQKFFREQVVGRLPVLQGRSASGIYARYAKCLKERLRRAISQGDAFQWLWDMHNVRDP